MGSWGQGSGVVVGGDLGEGNQLCSHAHLLAPSTLLRRRKAGGAPLLKSHGGLG